MGVQCSALQSGSLTIAAKQIKWQNPLQMKKYRKQDNLQRHVNVLKIKQKRSLNNRSARKSSDEKIVSRTSWKSLASSENDRVELLKNQQRITLQWRKANQGRNNIVTVQAYSLKNGNKISADVTQKSIDCVIESLQCEKTQILISVVFTQRFLTLNKITQLISQHKNQRIIANKMEQHFSNYFSINLQSKIAQLNLLQNWLVGLQFLQQKFGFFTLSQRMIGITSQNVGKVWISHNLASNQVQKPLAENCYQRRALTGDQKQRLMVLSLVFQIQKFVSNIKEQLNQDNRFHFIAQLKGKKIDEAIWHVKQLIRQSISDLQRRMMQSSLTRCSLTHLTSGDIYCNKKHSHLLDNNKKINQESCTSSLLTMQKSCNSKKQESNYSANKSFSSFSVSGKLKNIKIKRQSLKNSSFNDSSMKQNQNSSIEIYNNKNLYSTYEGSWENLSAPVMNKKNNSFRNLLNDINVNKQQKINKQSRFSSNQMEIQQKQVKIPNFVRKLRFDEDILDQRFQKKINQSKAKIPLVNSLFITAQESEGSVKQETQNMKFEQSVILRGLKQSNLDQKISSE